MIRNLKLGSVLAIAAVMGLCFATNAMAKPPEELLGTWSGETMVGVNKVTLILTFGKKEIAATYVTISGGKARTTRKTYKYTVNGKKLTIRWSNSVQTRTFGIKDNILSIPQGIDQTGELDMDRAKSK